MSILKYRAFLTTVECKSLTRAAERLGYTQPGISHMIASLEKEFGFPLLVRTKDGAVPTENAQYLRDYMQQIVSAQETMEELIYQIKGVEVGSLRIGSFFSPSTQWMPTIVATFLEKHPNIDLRIFEGTYDEVMAQLVRGEIDLAVASEPAPDNYDFLPLMKDPILAVLSRKNPLARGETVDIRELIRYPFILPNEGADESVRNVMQEEGLTPSIRFRIKGDMATLAMIGQDLGVSLIPKLAILPVWDDLVTRPLREPHFRTLGICIRSLKYASPTAKAFIQETRDYVQEHWTQQESE